MRRFSGSVLRRSLLVLLAHTALPAIGFDPPGRGIEAPTPVAGPTSNGDVNASGRIDISDVIYLANHLFLGGDPPAPMTCPLPGGDVEEPALLEDGYYRPLDLERAAEEQYGAGAVLVATGDHLYDWKVRVPTSKLLQHLDIAEAVADQYGSEWRVVMAGVHKYDWKAVRPSEPDEVVLPVVLVASDRFFDVAGVARAVERFRSVVGRVQSWYGARVGARLRVLEPLVMPTGLSSAEWDDLSAISADPEHRYDFLDECIRSYEASLPEAGSNLRVVLSPYTGESAGVWLGAAASGRYAAAPQRATSLDCPAEGMLGSACADAAYAIGHELGHTFGLGHSCDEYPGHPRCGESIMQTGRPPEAILLQQEVCELLASPFFHP